MLINHVNADNQLKEIHSVNAHSVHEPHFVHHCMGAVHQVIYAPASRNEVEAAMLPAFFPLGDNTVVSSTERDMNSVQG